MTDSKPMRAELVDDYRIKCALLLEEVIDAEEAAKLAAAEIAELRAERDRLKAAVTEALNNAQDRLDYDCKCKDCTNTLTGVEATLRSALEAKP